MKKALINQLKLEFMDRLTIRERGEIIKNLQARGLSLDQIGEIIGKNKSTIWHWVKGHEKIENGLLTVSVYRITEHFKKYIPKSGQIPELKQLILVIMECIKKGK